MANPITSSFGPIFLAPPLPPKRRKVHKLHLNIQSTPSQSRVVTTPTSQETQALRERLNQALEGIWKNNPIYQPKN